VIQKDFVKISFRFGQFFFPNKPSNPWQCIFQNFKTKMPSSRRFKAWFLFFKFLFIFHPLINSNPKRVTLIFFSSLGGWRWDEDVKSNKTLKVVAIRGAWKCDNPWLVINQLNCVHHDTEGERVSDRPNHRDRVPWNIQMSMGQPLNFLSCRANEIQSPDFFWG